MVTANPDGKSQLAQGRAQFDYSVGPSWASKSCSQGNWENEMIRGSKNSFPRGPGTTTATWPATGTESEAADQRG